MKTKKIFALLLAIMMILPVCSQTVFAIAQEETPEYCQVIFLDFDGTFVDIQDVPYGGSAVEPEEPIREGYRFIGWDQDFTYVTEDMEIHPIYEFEYYPIHFYDGLTGDEIGFQMANFDDFVEYPEVPEHEGYHFVGWDPEEIERVGTEGIDFFAMYEANEYSVVFVDGLTGEEIDTQSVLYFENAIEPEIPEHEGYHFVEWDTDFTTILGDTTVTAIYEIDTFTVTFVDGVTGEVIEEETVEYGADAVAPTVPEHEGYDFVEWDKQFDDVKENLTVTAIYNKQMFTVTFVDGLTEEVIAEVVVAYGENAQAPEIPVHEGYNFTGWDVEFSDVHNDITVTANYEKKIVKITFVDGVTGETIYEAEYEYGEEVVYPDAPEHEGYEFKSWDVQIMDATEDITITAQYERIETFMVIFVDNLTGEIIEKQEVRKGEAPVYPEAPVHEGYNFTGWDKEIGEVTANVTINAMYERIVVTLVFMDGFNGDVIGMGQYWYGSEVEYPEAPKHTGYDFIGWDKEIETATEDMVITAQYELRSIIVMFIDSLTDTIIGRTYVNYGDKISPDVVAEIEIPEHDGYTFTGWSKDIAEWTVTMPTEIKAVYTRNEKPSVEFETVNESENAETKVNATIKNFYGFGSSEMYVEFDSEALELVNVEIGAAFDNENVKFSVDDSHKADGYVVIKAVYEGKEVLKLDDGIAFVLSFNVKENAENGTHYVRLNAEKASFVEVNTKNNVELNVVDGGIVIDREIVEPTAYTVTFVDGVTGEVIAVVETKGEAVEYPEAPEHDNYIFVGWDKEIPAEFTENMTITSIYRLLGDANLDGKVESDDATAVLRYVAQLDEFNDEQLLVGDVNRDKKVESDDATLILRFVAQLIEKF